MIRGLSQLALATAVRFGTGVLTFVFAAKQWAPEQFGQFMYCFSLAAMFVLCTDFGFSQQVLNDVGSNPRVVSSKLSRFLAAKVWLTLLTTGLSVAYSVVARGFPWQGLMLMLLITAGCAGSFSELLLQTMRALGRYSEEMTVSLWTNGAAATTFLAVLLVGGTPIALALTFLVVRLAQLLLIANALGFAWWKVAKFMACLRPRRAFTTVKQGQAFAYEVMITASLTNVDTVLVARLSGFAEAGIYQAAARLSQGVSIAFTVVAGYFLPKLAFARRHGESQQRLLKRMFGVVAGVSVALTAAFWMVSRYYAGQPTGTSLASAASLLCGIAALVALRNFAASLATVLTAYGSQGKRTLVYAVALAAFAAVAALTIPGMGAWGALAAFLVAYSVLALGFAGFVPSGLRGRAFSGSATLVLLSAAALWLVHSYLKR